VWYSTIAGNPGRQLQACKGVFYVLFKNQKFKKNISFQTAYRSSAILYDKILADYTEKKEIKLSSYIRKFGMEQLQSRI
jgi:hypothetical protein